MNDKRIFIFALLGTVLLAACGNAKDVLPNVLLILTDDQGYADLSVHGSPDVQTPHMDRLKSQSISLEDFHVSASCAPTRAALMSGKHPFKGGITHTILERERLALDLTTLHEVLHRGGYMTAIFGKWHLGDEAPYQPDARGFDEVFIHGGGGIGQSFPGSCADVPMNKYFDPVIKHNGTFVKTSGFCTDIFFAQALAWINQQANGQKPFFAYLSLNAPHGPFIVPKKYKEKFIQQGYPENAQGFYGMIENIDDNLGLLMNKLDDWGIAKNTVLIFMSDNGKTIWGGENEVHGETYNAGLKGFKGAVDEGGTKVPFFIRYPGLFKSGRQIDHLLNHYDLLPTLAELAEIDISDVPDLDGRSFLPLLKEQQVTWPDRYRFFHPGRWPLNPNNLNGYSVPQWVGTVETSDPDNAKYKAYSVRNERYRFVGYQKRDELYDIKKDPGQNCNIAADYPEIVARMKQAYDRWWSEVRPNMINEDVPLAKGKPFHKDYHEQKNTIGIKTWDPPSPHIYTRSGFYKN